MEGGVGGKVETGEMCLAERVFAPSIPVIFFLSPSVSACKAACII